MTDIASRYLDLVKRSVLGDLYLENELRILYLRDCAERGEQPDPLLLIDIARARRQMADDYRAERAIGRIYGRTLRNLGYQHTMIGRTRLDNVEQCLRTILGDGVPGDAIECGVWRGGTCVFMRAVFAAFGVHDRTVWVADSFAGLPKPTRAEDSGCDLSADAFPMLAIDEDTVRETFERYGLLDGQVRFLKGWFRDSLPAAPIERLALLRLDGDLYESTLDSLHSLYHKVAPGGFVIVDDYGALPQCQQAVSEFRAGHEIDEPLLTIDWTGVFWRKSR
jgi:O-methyltransferase